MLRHHRKSMQRSRQGESNTNLAHELWRKARLGKRSFDEIKIAVARLGIFQNHLFQDSANQPTLLNASASAWHSEEDFLGLCK